MLFPIVVSRLHCLEKHRLKGKHGIKKMADKTVEVLKEAYDLLNPAKEQEERAPENFR